MTALLPALEAFARAHGGRFLLFGSAARGTITWHSDVDIMLDFPDDVMGEAWNFVERACWDRGLEPDLIPYRGRKKPFLDHVAPDMRVLA